MKLTKKNILDGKLYTMELSITEEEYKICYFNWQRKGVLVQDAFPMLNADEREFLMTGITPEEWEKQIVGDYNV